MRNPVTGQVYSTSSVEHVVSMATSHVIVVRNGDEVLSLQVDRLVLLTNPRTPYKGIVLQIIARSWNRS